MISKPCVVHHKYTNSFGAADRGAAIANKLVALGADVIFEAGGARPLEFNLPYIAAVEQALSSLFMRILPYTCHLR